MSAARFVAPAARQHGAVGLRVLRRSDAEPLRRLLAENRGWLEQWEATHPAGQSAVPGSVSMRRTVRALHRQLRDGTGIPFAMTYNGEFAGQLTVSGISGGAAQSASIGYWVSQRFAGLGITPISVALAIDVLFFERGLHRVEICIRPENAPSLRVVEKLGMRYEGRRAAFLHIHGAWRDHDCFAVLREEVPHGMLSRAVPTLLNNTDFHLRRGAAPTVADTETVQ